MLPQQNPVEKAARVRRPGHFFDSPDVRPHYEPPWAVADVT
jgi:hypothetical protein